MFPDNEIIVIDTLMTTILNKIIMDKVVELNYNNKSAEEIEECINKFRNAGQVLIMPEDLVYLNRGGRLSNLSYAIASAISIKPLITLKDGELKNLKNVMGVKKALMDFLKLAKTENTKTYLVEVYKSPYYPELIKMFDNAGVKVENSYKMDPVIGCHVGPGGIAMVTVENF